MSLASLPHRIPFNLGGLSRPAEIKAKGFTGVLTKKLPFTLSAVNSVLEVSYASVGWELICRAYNDFQTELIRTNDMNSLTFSKELSAFGAASFSLNLDHPLFQQAMNDGSSVDALFDKENLWEIRFDGIQVFQILGTAVVDSQINESEVRTATVTGSGIGKVLEWASVYPKGFPDKILTKLETLVDAFNGETVDRSVWVGTPMTPAITLSSMGQRREAERDIDTYQQEAASLTSQKTNATQQYNAEKADYATVMKNKTSTKTQKAEAEKQLNEAKLELDKINKAITANTALLTQATLRANFTGPLSIDEIHSHLKLTLSNAGVIYLTSGSYDLESSGISAGIQPGPSHVTSNGQIHTIFKIAHDPGFFADSIVNSVSTRNYARMYSARINGQLRIIAEIASDNIVSVEDWAYNLDTQKFWRIRDDNGYIIMDTSADNITWTRRFRADYKWPSKRVIFQFGLELIGTVGIAPPLSAYMYALNESTLPGTETAMQIFKNYLSESQARGVISYVKTSFTNSTDSRGIAWVGKPVVAINEGTKLSQLLVDLCQVQQADWIMDTDFNLNIFQRTKEDETIPPVFFRKDDVVFHEAGSQITKERTRNRDTIANSIVGKNALGEYAYIEDSDSISKYQRREAFITAGTVADLAGLSQILDSTLEDLKEEKTSWRIQVAADQPGRRIFYDYDVGDWISIENVDTAGNVTVGQWRVVGVAVNVASDASTTVELTLQSRMELLAQRLKQQVENLSASNSPGGTSLGNAITAAILIEQLTLSGLRDVVIGQAVEGDVLTYSRGFWVPIAPGDKTIPETPEIISVFTNVYYPADGVSVRAQAEISWTLPNNTDGSFITDGHHFELKYRPDTNADYPASWFEGSQLDWSETHTWGQPTIPPITNSGWQVLYVGWDEQSTVIQELTPGVDYELQIRAVDSSTPQHFSEWSEIYTFSAASDTIAPPKPAPPVIASSMLGIQITHYLGQSTGGTFNLPPDMSHLEVHVGGPSFYPNDASMLGKVVADQGLIRSGTPVIQSFNVESTENIWVRVIAVDKAGNKSSPSNAVTSTINLIDDAHISDLTASKITAGTISSSIILAGVIKTANSGARAEMNFEGFRIFSEDDDETVSLLGSPGTNGNFLLIKDLEDPGQTLAGIDSLGRGSFQSITVTNDIEIGGEQLIADIIDPRPKGVIAIGTLAEPVKGAGPGAERGFLEISFIAEESRTYMICAVTEWESDTADTRLVMRLRDFGEANPFLGVGSPAWLQQSITPNSTAAGGNSAAQITYAATFTPGLHRILWSFTANPGVITMNALASSGIESTTLMWVEDVGLPKTDTVIINDAGVNEYQAPASVDSPPAVKPKVEYTKNYNCAWSATYRSNGDYSSSHGNTMVQGDSGADNWLNDARSLCGFNYAQIMSDLKGATVKACYITLYASHWYWNDGGTARIGTHNYTGRPGSWSDSRVNQQRVSSDNWPKPGKRKVSLGTTIGNEFKSGTAKGIALGPTSGTKTQYGKFNGDSQSNQPVLTIVYVK